MWFALDSLSIVIAVYRAEASLPALYDALIAALEPLGAPFEIVFVEDCGGDRSWSMVQEIAARDPRIRGLKLSRNFGQHNALLCGIRAARNGVIVTMDDDLQHPPKEIARLLAKLEEGCDVVYGVPRNKRQNFLRRLASALTKRALQNAIGPENARNIGPFRAFRARLRDSFADFRGPFVSLDALLSWGTRNFGAVAVEHAPRHAGVSNYTVRMLINHALNLATAFSTFPLRFACILGAGCMLASLVTFLSAIVAYAAGMAVSDTILVIAAIALFSGVQLFVLGLAGEYLARIFGRTLGKPAYVIGETTPSVASEGARAAEILSLRDGR